MATTWSITATQIIRGALELNAAADPNEAVSAADSETCLLALNGIIKEMPLHGLSWPELSNAAVAVSWSVLTPGYITPPADYFGVPVLKYTNASAKLVTLTQLPRPGFDLLDLTKTAQYPEFFYESPNKTLYLWPIPTQDPAFKLTYQSIGDDATLVAAPDVQQSYLNLMQLWLADEISLKYGTSPGERQEISARLMVKRELMKQWAVDKAPISFEVQG